ncbi:hypothetical protein [Thalassoroseus pseudoceratinae]|uniref:hypothetical protein n=1 Tax=Thalassoroseus pseudoceratinae TaxID=2713176 RepID=UPI0014223AE0|nr:hypothetical protein [Thalassoroseus pseudoceratinae]
MSRLSSVAGLAILTVVNLPVTATAENLRSECFVEPTAVFSECGSSCSLVEECRQPELECKFDIPGWVPEMHGTTTVRGRTANVNVSTREIFESISDFNFIFSGQLEVSYKKWGFLANGYYYNLGVDRSVLPRIDLTAGFAQAIVDFAAIYNVSEDIGLTDWNQSMEADVLLGGRYNLLDTNEITITGPRGRSVTAAGSRQWVDPIIGGRFRAPVTDDFWLTFRGDVGGFGIGSCSQLTYNIEALGRFQCSEHCQLSLGYRLLDIDQEQGSGNNRFAYDMQLRGPIVQLGFQF